MSAYMSWAADQWYGFLLEAAVRNFAPCRLAKVNLAVQVDLIAPPLFRQSGSNRIAKAEVLQLDSRLKTNASRRDLGQPDATERSRPVPKYSLGSLWHVGVQTEPKSQDPNKASWHGGGCSRSVPPCVLGSISHSWAHMLSRRIGRGVSWT